MTDQYTILYVGETFVDEIANRCDFAENSRLRCEYVLNQLPGQCRSVDCIVCEHHPPELDVIEFLNATRLQIADVPAVLLRTDGTESLARNAGSADLSEYVSIDENGDSWADGAATVEVQVEELDWTGPHLEPDAPYPDQGVQYLADGKGGDGDEFIHDPAVTRDETATGQTDEGDRAIVSHTERCPEHTPSKGRLTDAIVEVDADWRFRLVHDRSEQITAIYEDDLVGEHFWEVFSEERGTRFEAVTRGVMETRRANSIDARSPTVDDWFHVEIYPKNDGGISLYFRQISGHTHHEDRMAGFHDMLVEVMDADTKQQVCDTVVEVAQDRLNFPVALVALVDDEGRLSPIARSTVVESHVNVEGLLDRDTGAAWEAFVTGDPATIDVSTADGDLLTDPVAVDELFVGAIGSHGILVLGSPVPDFEFAKTVVKTVRRSLDRVEREALLQERAELLEHRNERLDWFERILQVIREINQVLVEASTRQDIEQEVCEKLVEMEPYTFAWIGGFDAATKHIRPRAWAGDEQGYLGAVSFSTAEEARDQSPPARAVRYQTPQVMEPLTDPPREQWQELALRRDFQSSIALPLAYRDRRYGVLTVYADQPGLFDTQEREVLTELGELIATAINAAENKKALVSDSIVEMELRVTGLDHPLWDFLEEDPERTYQFEGIIPTKDGGFRAFHTFRGATPEDVLTAMRRSVHLRESQVIAERDDSCLFESIITEESLLFWLIDRGAVPQSMTAGNDNGRIQVELGGDVDVREFIEQFKIEYPNSRLVASRERERPIRTRLDFRTSIEQALTARQREVLQTAYRSGYFDSPRERRGTDIADSMNISPSTFSEHVRAGLRNLFGVLWEDNGDTRE